MFVYIVLLLLFSISIYLVYRYSKKKINKDFVENNEYKQKESIHKGDLYIFYASWCPHSMKTLEKINTIKANYPNLTFNEIDCDKNPDMADSYNIEAYPTLVLVFNNEKYYYDAELEENTFFTFVNTIMK